MGKRSLLVLVAASGMLVNCGGDPGSALPSGPNAPVPLSLDIIGPGSIPPGQSAQFIARLQMSDGSIKDATQKTNVLWRSSNSSRLQVNSAGFATAGQQMGDLFLTAEVAMGAPNQSRGLTREIIITPEGTYRLTGDVFDDGVPTLGIQGAVVEVSPGAITATTDRLGGFRLYGVPAVSNIQISHNQYVTTTRQLQLGAHKNEVFFLSSR